MIRHLLLHLEAPFMSFGAEAVDAYGVVRDFPARSAITGLIANALGWDRADTTLLDALQRRLIMGSARVREGSRMRDFQTAQLAAADRGWTTRGRPQGRDGNAATYHSPHIRYRDVDADAFVLVAMRLHPPGDAPDLDAVAAALDRPERPLFIGRKPFLPSRRLYAGSIEAASIKHALAAALPAAIGIAGGRDRSAAGHRGQWPRTEGPGTRVVELTDERNWRAGVHAGLSQMAEGLIEPAP